MIKPLPSLNAIRVFESAARLGSFKAAAEELHVTQSAVSRQIRLLERQLGAALFWRFNRSVQLTEAAETLLPCLTKALADIRHATTQVSRTAREPKQTRLVVAATPGIAERWLGSRLGDFIRAFPEIEPEITVVRSPLEEIKAGKVEVAIHWDKGEWPSFHGIILMAITEFPVCSPSLLEKGLRLETPSDLSHQRLLHLSSKDAWRLWLREFKVEGVRWNLGPVLSDISLCMSMAIAGEGVALGDEILAGDDLFAGRLVKPLGECRTLDRQLHLLVRQESMKRPEIDAFRGWLIDQIDSHLRATNELRQRKPFYAAFG